MLEEQLQILVFDIPKFIKGNTLVYCIVPIIDLSKPSAKVSYDRFTEFLNNVRANKLISLSVT